MAVSLFSGQFHGLFLNRPCERSLNEVAPAGGMSVVSLQTLWTGRSITCDIRWVELQPLPRIGFKLKLTRSYTSVTCGTIEISKIHEAMIFEQHRGGHRIWWVKGNRK